MGKENEKMYVNPELPTEIIPGDADNSSISNSPFNNLNEVDEHANDRDDEELSIIDKRRLSDKG